jgi:hypothetical protein
MKTTTTFIVIATLVTNLSATTFGPQDSHTVKSTNGKFELHVDTKSTTQRITGAFGSGLEGWSFQHEMEQNSFFVSDDGEAAAVVQWSWIQDYSLNKAAVVIYGRSGAERTFTYNELSKPRERKPEEIGPIGDFWRVWRSDATINGNLLTINIEGGESRVIDLKNPQALSPPQVDKDTDHESEKAPHTRGGLEQSPREREKNIEIERLQTSFRELKPMVEKITDDMKPTLFEGLPHQFYNPEQLAAELKTKQTITRHEFAFYKAPVDLAAADQQMLIKLIKSPDSFRAATGVQKLCGGFHPDFSLVWEINGSPVEIQFCFGCGEIKAYRDKTQVHCDIQTEAHTAIREILEKYHKQRPKPENEG